MTYPIGQTFRQSLLSSPPCGMMYPCRIILPLPLRAVLHRRPNNPCLVTSTRWTSIQYHIPPCLTLNRTSIAQTVHHNCHHKPFSRSSGKRTIHTPTKYNDYVPSDSIVDQLVLVNNNELQAPITVTPNSMPTALTDFITRNTIICTISDDTAIDPNSVKEARNSKYWNKWLAAMQEELASLKAKGVYKPVRTLPAS